MENTDSLNWYISQFPESLFPCDNNTYIQNVIKGKEVANQSSVLICGLARNVSKFLPYTIARIERLGVYFKNYSVFIYENDSRDNTKFLLEEWVEKNDRVCIQTDTLNPPPFSDPKGVDRRKYMAIARNKCLQYAKRQSVDYVIIVDTDLSGGWSYEGVFNSLGQSDNWDIVGSNSICYIHNGAGWSRSFYDTWALRFKNKKPSDIEKNDCVFNRGDGLISVDSCFGGLAIYKSEVLNSKVKYGHTDCDHVTLHKKLVKHGYRMVLNPNQITLYNGKIDFGQNQEPPKQPPSQFAINCDTHGFGDLMMLSWIAEGAKAHGLQFDLYATGNKKRLLELLNQSVIDKKDNTISLDGIFPHDQKWIKKHSYTRVNSWLRYFGLDGIQVKKPTYQLHQSAIDYAEEICDNNTIVLCPESIRPHREWPDCNWVQLHKILSRKGYNVLVLCYRGLYFKHLKGYIHDLSWEKIFAVFERSKLVIGCDSAPIHAAGMTETPAIALLGPTTHHVFDHLKNVKCINTKKAHMSCVGCWLYEEFDPNPCDFGCVALCCISPNQVYNKAIKMINND